MRNGSDWKPSRRMGFRGAAGNRGFPVVLPVVLLLAGMLIEPFVPGIYSAEEMHPHMVLAEPGTRGVPQWNPRFDGDGTAFTALDRDGSGGIECRPLEGVVDGIALKFERGEWLSVFPNLLSEVRHHRGFRGSGRVPRCNRVSPAFRIP